MEDIIKDLRLCKTTLCITEYIEKNKVVIINTLLKLPYSEGIDELHKTINSLVEDYTLESTIVWSVRKSVFTNALPLTIVDDEEMSEDHIRLSRLLEDEFDDIRNDIDILEMRKEA